MTTTQVSYRKIVGFIIIATIITDSLRYISNVNKLEVASATYISTFLNYTAIFLIIYLYILEKSIKDIPSRKLYLFNIWIFLNLINIIRGFFVAEGYWEWKNLLLTTIPATFVTLMFYIGNSIKYARYTINFFLRIVLTIGIFLIPLSLITNKELYSRIMIPVSFLLVFIPYLKNRWKVLLLVVSVVSVLIVIEFRTNIIKVVFSYGLIFLYVFHAKLLNFVIRILHSALFLLPIVLLFLALTNRYNILAEISKNDNYILDNDDGRTENLMNDSRTFLYVDVLTSLNSSSELLFGRSQAGSYQSMFFYDTGGAMKGKRFHCEVNLLNILLYNGLLGVFIYSILMFYLSYIAIFKSNNTLSKVIGLLIASRWLFSFVEELTQFDLNFIYFWLLAGLISNSEFRLLNNTEVKQLFYK